MGGPAHIPLYEAAPRAGATGLRKHLRSTLPVLSPTLLVASVVGVINGLQAFEQPYVLIDGGPGEAPDSADGGITSSGLKD